MPVTKEQEQIIKQYLEKKLSDQIMDGGEKVLSKTFEDTGRETYSPIDVLQSYSTAPTRKALSEMLAGQSGTEGFASQFGKDPQTAPQWVDLVGEAGVEDPYLATALATALDVLEPVPGAGLLGRGIPMSGAIYRKGEKLAGKEAKEELAKLIAGDSVKDPRYLYMKKPPTSQRQMKYGGGVDDPTEGLRQEHAYNKRSQFGWLHDEGFGDDPTVVNRSDYFPFEDFGAPGGEDRLKRELALAIVDAEKTPVLTMADRGVGSVKDGNVIRTFPGPQSGRIDSSLHGKLFGAPGKGTDYVVDNPVPDYVLTNKELVEYMKARNAGSIGLPEKTIKAERMASKKQADAAHLEGEMALEAGDRRGQDFSLVKGELDEKAVQKRINQLSYEIENAKTVLEKRKLEAKRNALEGAEMNTRNRKKKD